MRAMRRHHCTRQRTAPGNRQWQQQQQEQKLQQEELQEQDYRTTAKGYGAARPTRRMKLQFKVINTWSVGAKSQLSREPALPLTARKTREKCRLQGR